MREQEQRYLLSEQRATDFIAQADGELPPLVYEPQRPIAYTKTTYLDTRDQQFLRSCRRSERHRRLRVREYAAAYSVTDQPVATGVRFLELKESQGVHRRKLRVSVTDAQAGELLDGGAAFGGAQVFPQVASWYRRRCWSGEGLRITVDEQLAFCVPGVVTSAGAPVQPGPVIARSPHCVLEIKSTSRWPAWLQRAVGRPVGGESLAVADYSKFCAGMDELMRAGATTVDKRSL